MKYRILYLFLAMITQGSYGQTNSKYFYYYDDEKVMLELDKSVVSINVEGDENLSVFKNSHSNNSNKKLAAIVQDNTRDRLNPADQSAKSRQSIKTYYSEVGISDKLNEQIYLKIVDEYKNKPEILMASPCFKTKENKTIGLSNTFYVKLKNENDVTLLYEKAKNIHVEVLGQNKFMPLWYTLSCNKASKLNSMEAANLFYETGSFQSAEPAFIFQISKSSINDPLYPNQWGLKNTGQQNTSFPSIDIHAEQAWTITTGNQNIKIAVYDDGFETNHPDLQANIFSSGFDIETGASPAQIWGDHGTLCAGIVGAVQNNNLGVSGVVPTSKIFSVSCAFQFTDAQRLADGFSWAYQNGADVISNSWGFIGGFPSSITNNAITNALTYGRGGKGTVIVFAAGNENNTSIRHPQVDVPQVLVVGAISPCGERKSPSSCDSLTWGSCYGTQLDIMAPGVNIPTTDRQGSNTSINDIPPNPGDYELNFGGTSSACPHVAGIAALILSVNPNLTAQQVNDIIEKSAQKIRTDLYSYTTTSGRPNGTWNYEMGYGLADAYQAVLLASPVVFTPPLIVCSGNNLADLSLFVSPAGGIFSGSGVTLNGNIYSFSSTTAGLGTHQLVYTYTNAIGTQTVSATINVVNNACILPGGNSNQVVAGSYINSSTNFGFSSALSNPILISGNIDIGNGSSANVITLTCPDVRISPGVKIKIKKNAKLIINGSWLRACNQCDGSLGMWQGLEVEPGAFLEILGNSIIEDAITAVKAQAASAGLFPNLKITNTVFNKNDLGISIAASMGINIQPVITNNIRNCVFTCRTLPSTVISGINFSTIKNNFVNQSLSGVSITQTLAQTRSRYGIYVADQSGVAYKIGVASSSSANAEVNVFDNLDFGIYSVNSLLTVKNNIFQNCSGKNNSGSATGIGICGVNPAGPSIITIGNDYSSTTYPLSERNIFRNLLRGIDLANYSKAYVINNSLDNSIVNNAASNFSSLDNNTGEYGILLQPQSGNTSTSDYRINKNIINNCYYGIHVKRTVNYQNNIYEVKTNNISKSGANYFYAGIFLEDAGNNTPGGTGTLNISYNTVVSADYFAIVAKNIRKGLSISDNSQLSITAAYPAGALYSAVRASIGLFDCEDASVERNSFIKSTGFTQTPFLYYANLNLYGIYAHSSKGTKIRCNTVEQTSIGIAFDGNCSASNYRATDFTFNNIYTTNYGFAIQNGGVIGQQGNPNCPAFNRFGNYGPKAISIAHTLVNGFGTNPNSTSVYYANNTACGTNLSVVEKPCTNVTASNGGTAYAYGTTTGIIPTITTCQPPPDNCGISGGGTEKASGIILSENDKESMKIKLYPNPNNGSFKLEYPQSGEVREGRKEAIAEFVVYDINGKQVYSELLAGTTTQKNVQLDELKNGIYYYNIIQNNQILQTDKLVIIK